MQEGGLRVLFATNNGTATVEQYRAKLARLSIRAEPRDILTSAVVTADHLVRRGWSGRSAFVIGRDGIREALDQAGIRIVEGEEGRAADLVVVSGDPGFSYDALRTASFAVRAGAHFIATNDDPTFPASDGLWPGAGALVAAVETASGRAPEVIGKPHRPMMEAAARRLEGCRAVAVVGDLPATDLAGGRLMGWLTVLVLSGVTPEAYEVAPAPDLVLPSLSDLAPLVLEGR